MTTRDKFVEAFGEENARTVEAAAASHRTDDNPQVAIANMLGAIVGDKTCGGLPETADDQFLADISVCISYECMWKESYLRHHGFTMDREQCREWVRANAVPPKSMRDHSHCYAEYLGEER